MFSRTGIVVAVFSFAVVSVVVFATVGGFSSGVVSVVVIVFAASVFSLVSSAAVVGVSFAVVDVDSRNG